MQQCLVPHAGPLDPVINNNICFRVTNRHPFVFDPETGNARDFEIKSQGLVLRVGGCIRIPNSHESGHEGGSPDVEQILVYVHLYHSDAVQFPPEVLRQIRNLSFEITNETSGESRTVPLQVGDMNRQIFVKAWFDTDVPEALIRVRMIMANTDGCDSDAHQGPPTDILSLPARSDFTP